METLVAKVKGIRVFESQDGASVHLTLDKEYEGYKQDENGQFVKTKTNKVSFYRSTLTAQLCDASDDIAMYRACQERSLTQHQFGVILFNAELTMNLEEHSAGETVEVNGVERTIDRDCVFSTITKVRLTDKAIACIDETFKL